MNKYNVGMFIDKKVVEIVDMYTIGEHIISDHFGAFSDNPDSWYGLASSITVERDTCELIEELNQ